MSERIDEIGFGGYKLIQDTDGFCYGVDAVLLADFSACTPKESVLDLCCGNGAVSFIISAKYGPERIVGLELQQRAADLARKSAVMNSLSEKISFICGDAAEISEHLPAGSFDLVVCNPPYFERNTGVSCEESVKHMARHETSAGIAEFIAAGAYSLKKGGRMCLIHRPSRLPDLIYEARKAGMEPKMMRFVVPHAGEAPNLVLIQLVKGAGKELKVLPQIAVRMPDGSWTEEIDAIYGRTKGE